METSIAVVVFVVTDTAVSTATTASGATESEEVESDGREGREGRDSIAVTVDDDSKVSSSVTAAVAIATVCGALGASSKGDTETSVGAAMARDSISLESLSTEIGDDARCC